MSDMDVGQIETLSVSQGWDLVDSIRSSNEQAIERWRVKSEIAAPPPPQTRKPRRFSATRMARSTEHIVNTESANPAEDRLIRLRVTDIEEFEFNPRKFVGENYIDLKESIRISGIESTISVTNIPGHAAYTIAAGGNSRLRAIQELYAEAKNPKFEFITCRVTPFIDVRSLKFAHVRENNHRSDMCFWDKANAALDLLHEYERAEGRKAKNEEAVEYLLQGDRAISVSTLSLYRFAVEYLGALGSAAQSLQLRDVQSIFRPEINSTLKLANLFEVEQTRLRHDVIDTVLSLISLRFEELRTFDAQAFPVALRDNFARIVGISKYDVERAAALQQKIPGLTIDSLRTLLRQQATGNEQANVTRSRPLASPASGMHPVSSSVPAQHNISNIVEPTLPSPPNRGFSSCESSLDLDAQDTHLNVGPLCVASSESTDFVHLLQRARELVDVCFGRTVTVIECPRLPYGFIVELPQIDDEEETFAANADLWWHLLVITEQGSLKGMQVLPPSEFAELCLQNEDWANTWKAKFGMSRTTNQNPRIYDEILSGSPQGDAFWHFLETARDFRKTHRERFCSDFWVQQGVAV